MKRFLTAAAAALAALQILAAAGCSASSSSGGAARASSGASYGANTTVKSTADTAGGGISSSASSESAAPASGSSKAAQSDSGSGAGSTGISSGRKVIMAASLTLQTTAYDKSAAELETLVLQFGGFIQDSSTQGTGFAKDNSPRTATYTVRVPAGKLDRFLASAGTVGKLLSKTMQGEDISKQYYDTDTQLATLKVERQRVLDIMSRTKTMTDMLTAEQRLSEIDGQINQLTGELQQWNSLVELSTVNITLNEVKEIAAPAPKTFGERLGSVFMGSLRALKASAEVLLQAVVAVVPFAAVLGVLFVLVLVPVRLVKKRRAKREAQKPKEPIV